MDMIEAKFVLYSPRQNAFHIENADEVPVNALETIKAYLKAEDKNNYNGADYMLIGVCLLDKVDEIIDSFKKAIDL